MSFSAKQIHVLLSNANKDLDLGKFSELKKEAGYELRDVLIPNAKDLFGQYDMGLITHHELINGLVRETINACQRSTLLATCVQFDRTAHMGMVGITRFDQFETWVALLFDMAVEEYHSLLDTPFVDELLHKQES